MRRHVTWLLALFLLAESIAAQAQAVTSERPWEQGVSVEQKQAARHLFRHAVELHEVLLRDQAVAKYQEALSLWENPEIRWNLVLILKDMGQYLHAYEHLEQAWKWGLEAFAEADRAQMIEMKQTLLTRHLAIIEARSEEPGAEIELDGKPWFVGPGFERKVVLPGEHVITARKTGYFPVARAVSIPAGRRGKMTLLMTVDGVFERRRWPAWKPWAVVGAGMATALLGAWLDRQGDMHLSSAERALDDRCGSRCSPEIPSSYGRAVWENRIGIGALAAGNGVAAVGLILVVLNQPVVYRSQAETDGEFSITPFVAAEAVGFSARVVF